MKYRHFALQRPVFQKPRMELFAPRERHRTRMPPLGQKMRPQCQNSLVQGRNSSSAWFALRNEAPFIGRFSSTWIYIRMRTPPRRMPVRAGTPGPVMVLILQASSSSHQFAGVFDVRYSHARGLRCVLKAGRQGDRNVAGCGEALMQSSGFDSGA